MTEYDFSPEAYSRYEAKIQSVGRWRDDTDFVKSRGGLRNPYTPCTPSVEPTRELDRDYSSHLNYRRDRDRDITRPKTTPPREDHYISYQTVPHPQYHYQSQPTANTRPIPTPLPLQYAPRYSAPAPSPLSPNYHRTSPQGAIYPTQYPVAIPVPQMYPPVTKHAEIAPKSTSYTTNGKPYLHPAAVRPVPDAPPPRPKRAQTAPFIPPPLPLEDPIMKRTGSPLLKRVFGGIFGGSGNGSRRDSDSSTARSTKSRYSEDSSTRHSPSPVSPDKHSRKGSYDSRSHQYSYHTDDSDHRGRDRHDRDSGSRDDRRSKSTHRNERKGHSRRERRNSYT